MTCSSSSYSRIAIGAFVPKPFREFNLLCAMSMLQIYHLRYAFLSP